MPNDNNAHSINVAIWGLSDRLLARIIASTRPPGRLVVRSGRELNTAELLRAAPVRGAPGYAVLLASEDGAAQGLLLLSGSGRAVYAELREAGRVLRGPQALEALRRSEAGLEATVAPLRLRLVDWGPRLSVYVKGIDLQHRQLLAALNTLWESVLHDAYRTRLYWAVGFLEEYTVFHFRSEERFFTSRGYPRAEQHIRQHRWFVDQVARYRSTLSSVDEDNVAEALDVVGFLADWVENHIAGADRDYGEWARKAGLLPGIPSP